MRAQGSCQFPQSVRNCKALPLHSASLSSPAPLDVSAQCCKSQAGWHPCVKTNGFGVDHFSPTHTRVIPTSDAPMAAHSSVRALSAIPLVGSSMIGRSLICERKGSLTLCDKACHGSCESICGQGAGSNKEQEMLPTP